MTLIWCLSPLVGFFLTPILGSLSDRYWYTVHFVALSSREGNVCLSRLKFLLLYLSFSESHTSILCSLLTLSLSTLSAHSKLALNTLSKPKIHHFVPLPSQLNLLTLPLVTRCKSPLGRRRPFIILLSIGVVLGLLLVPNGKALGRLMGDKYYDKVTNTQLIMYLYFSGVK